MRAAVIFALGLASVPAAAQDLKVLLCTADTQLNLYSSDLEPSPSDETYTWELYYEENELVSVSAPFACLEGTEEWKIGVTVISMTCEQGVLGAPKVVISAEIDRYAQSFMVSGIGRATDGDDGPSPGAALWVQEGQCELARRKF